VLAREPRWGGLPSNLHPRIRLLLERCLSKEPKDRYGSISDARVDVRDALADPGGVLVQPVIGVDAKPKLRQMLPWAAIALILIVIAGVAAWMLKPAPPPEPKRVMRFNYELPPGGQFNRNAVGAIKYQMAVSPDGSQFVYSTTDGLFLRSLNAPDDLLIAGTDKDSRLPFFSPDGQWIGYFSQSEQKLKKVAVSGGAPVVLCDTGSEVVTPPSWDLQDTIVYSDIMNGIMRVSANGGTPETLVKGSIVNATKQGFPIAPQLLPDGKTLLFSNIIGSNSADIQIVAQSLESGERKILFKGGTGARYIPTGHIVYTLTNNNINNLFAVPFDLDKLEVTGGPVSVLEGVAGFALSDSGTLVYVPQQANAAGAAVSTSTGNTLVWVDREGKEEPLGAAPDAYQTLKISPDGSRVALSIGASENQDIWIWDIPHKTPTRLTFDKADDTDPLWTPDGKQIVFLSLRGGLPGGVYRKSADGIGEAELLGSGQDKIIAPTSFSRDGKTLALSELSLTPLGADIGMMSMEGKREIKELLKEKYFELEPQISPDGRFVAYQSDESGKGQIYVRSFPNVNQGRWQVSSDGGGSPLWSPDGRELFYRNGDATMAVRVETEPAFQHANPEVLFRGTYLMSSSIRTITMTPWDIHPNGKKFLMIKPPAAPATETTTQKPAPAPQTKIRIVVNWFEELKQRVPAGK
jgi:Tol biopolymer transport system component